MDTLTNGQRRSYFIDGALAGIKVVLAALPGVADMNEEELFKVVRGMNLNTDKRTGAQEISAHRFVKETLALARRLKVDSNSVV
jgi:hypothetical protein